MPTTKIDFFECIPVEGELAISGTAEFEPAYRGSFSEAPHGVTESYSHCVENYLDARIGGRTFRFNLTLRHVVVGEKEQPMTREQSLALLERCLADEVGQNCGERLVAEYERNYAERCEGHG